MNEQFDRLVSNGLDFLKASIEDLERERPKFAVISFFTGVELLFKARLMQPDWRQCFISPAEADLERLESGDARTVGFTVAKERLKKLHNEQFDRVEAGIYDNLRRRRNQAVHFYQPERVGSKEKVAVEQLVGWNYLFRRLKGGWRDEFEPFVPEIESLDSKMRQRADYFPLVFKQRSKEISKESKSKHCGQCSECGQRSAVADSQLSAGLQRMNCRVCEAERTAVFMPCRKDGCKGEVERAFQKSSPCPKCGLSHQADPGESFNFFAGMNLEPIAWCGMCGYSPRKSVVSIEEGCLCLACHTLLDPWHLRYCQWCSENVTGPVGDQMNPGCVRCAHYICFESCEEEAPEFMNGLLEWESNLRRAQNGEF